MGNQSFCVSSSAKRYPWLPSTSREWDYTFSKDPTSPQGPGWHLLENCLWYEKQPPQQTELSNVSMSTLNSPKSAEGRQVASPFTYPTGYLFFSLTNTYNIFICRHLQVLYKYCVMLTII